MRENKVIDSIENFLRYYDRYHINVHGSTFSANGTPDIITHDKDNKFLAIEAKVSGKYPTVNQWRHGIDILNTGGRFIVAYEDFDLMKIDQYEIRTVEVGNTIGLDEFKAAELKLSGTTEVILKK